MNMSYLKELTIAEELNSKSVSPVLKARARLIEALKEQLKAAEAMVAGEIYTITKMRWQTNDDTSERVRVPIQVPLRKWYWRDAEGQVRFSLRVRNKKLELKKGKTDIIVGDDRQLPSVIENCLSAVEAGELDGTISVIVIGNT
jgi:hypothetical protein